MNIPPVSGSSRKAGIALISFLFPVLALLIWSGSSWDPRSSIPWTFTKDGWLAPAPGLAFLWLSSGLLFAILSGFAYFRPAFPQRGPWLDAALVFLLAFLSRVAIAHAWFPLPLNQAALSAKVHHPTAPLHALAICADMVVVALLLYAMRRAGKSPWWAALYALHPLVLIEIAGNGHWITFAIIPLVLLATFADALPRWARLLISGVFAFITVTAIAAAASHGSFNSLIASFFPENRIVLPALAAMLQGVVLLVSLRRDWALSRTLSHIFVLFLLCSPVTQPWNVLLVLALIPFAWNSGGWVLSLVVLAAYAAIPVLRSGEPWHIPLWLLMLEWIPVMVLEAQELLAECFSPRSSQAAPSALAAGSLP